MGEFIMAIEEGCRESQLQAVYEFLGGWSTSLYQASNVGDKTIVVSDQPPANTLSIKVDQGASAEGALIKSVTGTGPYTLNLAQPLRKQHSAGIVVTTYTTYNPSLFPGVKTLVMGEPLQKLQAETPLVWITVPTSREHRDGAASTFKYIDFAIQVNVLNKSPASQPGGADRGASLLNEFYNFLDQFADKIRTNKQLTTKSYPGGASSRFGEDLSIQEQHGEEGQTLLIGAQIDIKSEVQVIA